MSDGTYDYDKTMGLFDPMNRAPNAATSPLIVHELRAEIERLRAPLKEKEDLHAEIVRLRDYKRKQAEDIMTLSQMVGKLETEIDWLQAARRRALAIADERSKENVDLRAENERLRKLVDLSATSCSPPR